MTRPARISFGIIVLVLVLTGWLHMGTLLLLILFSYFIIRKLRFAEGQAKWVGVVVFLLILAGLAYAVAYFIHETVIALPKIAERAVPAIIRWADEHKISLPFTDMESLKDKAFEFARNQADHLGNFADFARGATAEFVRVVIGIVVAIELFLHPQLELESPGAPVPRRNLYSLCCEEISLRFATFYNSFDMVMRAQMTISTINTAATAIFAAAMGLPHLVVAVGLTFLCGFLPVIGNLVSNTLVVALGFIVSPTKGLLSLAFLVVIHKLEYFLNSKIIGSKIHTPVWLTLIALLLGERLMGITGMVLAPVLLHYIRIEAAKITVE